MATTTTTKETEGITTPTEMTVVAPPDEMPQERLDAFLQGTGLNGRFLADLLSQFLAHEQAGYHLYRTVAGRTQNPMLKAQYDEFGTETENHIRILEELIARVGGEPGYVSPAARMTESTGTKLVEAVALLAGSADIMTLELAMLEAVLLAETKDHAHWSFLEKLADDLPSGDLKEAFRSAVDEVEPQEDKHVQWAQTNWERMVNMQVKSTVATKAMESARRSSARSRTNWDDVVAPPAARRRFGAVRPVAVTFDYWNTLFAEPVPGGAADARLRRFRAWLRDRGSEHPDELVLEAHESAYRVHWEAWRAGTQFGSPGAVNHVLAELRLELTTAERSELQALFEDPDPELRLRPLEGVGEALERLRSAGVGLGVVCDAGFMPGRVLRRHLLSEGLGGFFEPDALAFSDEVGVYKPHPDIFRAALRALGAEPVEAVHVGDLKVTDVAGARRVGMASIRYTGSNDDAGEEGPEADAVISHHRDLPGVLGLACARRGRSRVTSRSEAAWRRGAGRAPTSPGS